MSEKAAISLPSSKAAYKYDKPLVGLHCMSLISLHKKATCLKNLSASLLRSCLRKNSGEEAESAPRQLILRDRVLENIHFPLVSWNDALSFSLPSNLGGEETN